MWNLPGSGIAAVSPALAGIFLTTGPPGKSCFCVLFFLLSYMSSLFVFDINLLTDIWFTNIFSHFIGYLFTLLIVSFGAENTGSFCKKTSWDLERWGWKAEYRQYAIFTLQSWVSLVAQMVKNWPAMQETRVGSLIWEDPTCLGATKPLPHNYWACALEPGAFTKEATTIRLRCTATRE